MEPTATFATISPQPAPDGIVHLAAVLRVRQPVYLNRTLGRLFILDDDYDFHTTQFALLRNPQGQLQLDVVDGSTGHPRSYLTELLRMESWPIELEAKLVPQQRTVHRSLTLVSQLRSAEEQPFSSGTKFAMPWIDFQKARRI